MVQAKHSLVVKAPIEHTYAYVAFLFAGTCRSAFPGMEVTESGADTYGMPTLYAFTVDGNTLEFHVVERNPRDSFILISVEQTETTDYHFTFTPEGEGTNMTLDCVLTAHLPNVEEYEYHAQPKLQNMVLIMVQRLARTVEEISGNIRRGKPDLELNMERMQALFDLDLMVKNATAGQRTGSSPEDALYRPAEQVKHSSISGYVRVLLNGEWYGPVRMTFGPLDGDKEKSTAIIKDKNGIWYMLWFFDRHIQPFTE